MKRLTRIVVVDDERDSVPMADLQANGYAVDYWESLNAERFARLERGEFDIILLDIQGIVTPGFSDTGDGLGILRRLKATNPSQVVVACSGQSYSLDAMDFYRKADATLAKPITSIRAMECVDELMRSRVGARVAWEGIVAMLRTAGVDQAKIDKLERAIATSAKKERQLAAADIEKIVGHVGTIVTVSELAKKAITFIIGGP